MAGTVDDILSEKQSCSRKVVVDGGDFVSCETAEYLVPLVNDRFSL